jgi:hypothetical protein
MVNQPDLADPATYEIRLQGHVPANLRQEFPTMMACHHHRAETVLCRDLTDSAELDVLLERLQSMSLVLLEIREFAPDPLSAAADKGGELR